jgi:hypothetical protein
MSCQLSLLTDYTPPHVLLAQTYFRLKRTAEAKREREFIDRLYAKEQGQQLSIGR